MTIAASFLSRRERFNRVGSTNDVVRGWLAAGIPEVCLASADEQTAGRGREGRTWIAPPGAAALLSVGFRPRWLEPDRAWRLPAVVSLAMAHAAEDAAGLPVGTIRLKWPNDLVIEGDATTPGAAAATTTPGDTGAADHPVVARKLAGVLGESVGLGTDDPQVIVGIGVNVNWRRDDFPPDLAGAMTSLIDASGGPAIDDAALLVRFLGGLEERVRALRTDRFDVADWRARQLTTGRRVVLQLPDGRADAVDALDVDELTGALVVDGDAGRRAVFSGEIRHLRFPAVGLGV